MTTVLFVCVHNAGRSQMAAAIFNVMARKMSLPLSASSAGTQPAVRVHPNVVRVMEECGVDLARNTPQTLTDEMASGARRVITMGCEVDSEACPAILLRHVEDWGLPDPAGLGLEETRAVRDMISAKVRDLIEQLGGRSVAEASELGETPDESWVSSRGGVGRSHRPGSVRG